MDGSYQNSSLDIESGQTETFHSLKFKKSETAGELSPIVEKNVNSAEFDSLDDEEIPDENKCRNLIIIGIIIFVMILGYSLIILNNIPKHYEPYDLICGHGTLKPNKTNDCYCDKLYGLKDNKCNYELKSRKIAVLLQFIPGLGLGYLYTGYYTTFVYEICFTSLWVIGYFLSKMVDNIKIQYKGFGFFMTAILIIWWLGSTLIIMSSETKDSNGYKLENI